MPAPSRDLRQVNMGQIVNKIDHSFNRSRSMLRVCQVLIRVPHPGMSTVLSHLILEGRCQSQFISQLFRTLHPSSWSVSPGVRASVSQSRCALCGPAYLGTRRGRRHSAAAGAGAALATGPVRPCRSVGPD